MSFWLLIPLVLMGYASLVSFTWQLAVWIVPIDEQSMKQFAGWCGSAGDRWLYLLTAYPIAAPFQLMWAIRLRTDMWRERKALKYKRQAQLDEIEHQTRVKELQQAAKELDKFLTGGG